MEKINLNEANIPKIAQKVDSPTYDRPLLKEGIIHIGVGGFHRSHQAYYIHQMIEKFGAHNWAICGVGLREADRKMASTLRDQDYLYTLITQYPNGNIENKIIGSITEYLLAVDNTQAVIDKMAHPDTKIVSLTITEGGYNFNPNTGEFNFQNPDIQHELNHPNEPRTVYGYLTAALKKRYDNGIPPFTILSCDNIQHNGDMIRKMLLAFSQKQDSTLSQWIEAKVAFPNSMVDRITPFTTDELRTYLQIQYDVIDNWPVVCEPFIQWVIEDKFSNGRPELEKLNVQFVPDVTPYEKMKIRLLNAGHSTLGIPGAIHGHPTIDQCMNDEVFRDFLRAFMDTEVTPILGKIEGIDVEKYKDTLEERFANANIKDSVSRICSESSAKLPKFLIPTIQENLENGGPIQYATFLLAAWCYYSDKGQDENGQPIKIIDAQKIELHEASKHTESNWTSFLKLRDIFGDLTENEIFIKEYTHHVQAIYTEKNIRKLMGELLE